MRLPALYRKAITAWVLWRARRRVHGVIPALAALDQRRAVLSRRHVAGAKAIDAERTRLVTERLRMEVGL